MDGSLLRLPVDESGPIVTGQRMAGGGGLGQDRPRPPLSDVILAQSANHRLERWGSSDFLGIRTCACQFASWRGNFRPSEWFAEHNRFDHATHGRLSIQCIRFNFPEGTLVGGDQAAAQGVGEQFAAEVSDEFWLIFGQRLT
jgi:hypothetical protein